MATEETPLLSSQDRGHNIEFKTFQASIHKDKATLVSVKQLFRFCDGKDRILLIFGVIGCILYGFITPGQFVLLGSTTEDFIDYGRSVKDGKEVPFDLEERTTKIAIWYIVIAVTNMFFSWMGLGLFALSAELQVHKIRLALFKSAIYQDIGWFDLYTAGEINTRLTEDTNKIGDGIGLKFGHVLSCMVSFIFGYGIGFLYVWRLTLVLIALFPFIIIVGAVMVKATGDQTAKELAAYSKADYVAEQSISAIRTVAAYGGEQKQAKLYEEHISDACKFGIKKGFVSGLGLGAFQVVLYANFCLSMWYLVKLTKDEEAKAGDGVTTFFAGIIGALMLGQAVPSGKAIAVARGAAGTVFEIIDRQSKIDASSNTGLKPEVVKGDVEFSHIDFSYPTRQSVPILNDFSLKISSGSRVALVGDSGSGKSTVVKLIQRFYDPTKGCILLDGQDIKSLNVRHLRKFIGVVNQEPVLFATTISENIAYGCEGVTQREIEEASKMANAHEFITRFPQSYDTFCGERGAKMSGGQKQRIAIARALVRNPKILLLDEATSALDTESEVVVQEALDKAGEGRTTIIIAHRLSTIKSADVIVVVGDGAVNEIGTHEELMARDGLYSTLVKLQEGDEEDEDEGIEQTFDENLAIKSVATSATSHFQTMPREDDEGDAGYKVPLSQILKLNAPEWHFLLIGCFGAALYGTYPFLFGISFGGITDAISKSPRIPEEREVMDEAGIKWPLFFLGLGITSGIGIFLQNYFFAKAGETLTMRLRKKAFLTFLRQNIGYFDKPNHGTGATCARLSSEMSCIQGATGSQFGVLCSAIVTLVGGFVVALEASWQLGLTMIAFIPFLSIAGMFFNTFLGGGRSQTTASVSEPALMAEETLSNIQTVVSLGREEEFFERYRVSLEKSLRKAKRVCHISGLANGMLMAIVYLSFGAGFRCGGHLAVERKITTNEMMRSIFTIILCAITVGQVPAMIPYYVKAKKAANRVFHLFQSTPDIDSYSDAGKSPETCNGGIQISNVRFRYPTRRNFKVLRNISFTVKPGQTVALVGPSGCGKSTSVSLVERFYDVDIGEVLIDGRNVKELNLKWLRSHIGIVSQEPVLFDLSVRDNIAYGDTTRYVSDKEILDAARAANIHKFINSLPQGYNTMVGDKGTLISGGQKQRIAIARALIRDPKILLLDEATSAMDTRSEKVVQKALDKARIGRTTIVIAHRLSTIQNADLIVVIKNGRVIESGEHNELMALKGIYHALQKTQSMSYK